MKKQLTALLLLVLLLFAITGCSAAKAAQKLDAAEDIVEEKLDAVEDKVEDSLRKAITPAPAAAPTEPVAPATPAAPTVPAVVPTVPEQLPPETTQPAEKAQELTKEQALQIALDYLGIPADQVSRQRVEYEIDDGISQFDIELLHGDWEYEFEIHAENGKILSYDKDHKYD